MDQSVWLPWVWGAGAAICGVLLYRLQPWRPQFERAWTALRQCRGLWLAPVMLTAAGLAWQWQPPQPAAARPLTEAALLTGDSLAEILTWILRGEVPAMVLAAAFLANSAGLRRGVIKGLNAAFSPGWSRAFHLILLASATAALGIPAVRFGAGGEHGLLAVKVLAAPWTGTSATLIMVWLILTFEAAARSPGQPAKAVRWEITGQYATRLWIAAMAGTVLFPLMDYAGTELRSVLRAYAWPAAAMLAWLPWAALRAPEAGEIHVVFRSALHRLAAQFLPFLIWVLTAGVCLYGLHLASLLTATFAGTESWWQPVRQAIFGIAGSALAVFLLGSWVCIQTQLTPAPSQTSRSPRRKSAPPA